MKKSATRTITQDNVINILMAVLVNAGKLNIENNKQTSEIIKIISPISAKKTNSYSEYSNINKALSEKQPNSFEDTFISMLNDAINILNLTGVKFNEPVQLNEKWINGINFYRKKRALPLMGAEIINKNNKTFPIRVDVDWKSKIVTSYDLEMNKSIGIINSYYLYQSYKSAYDWEMVAKSPEYILSKYCTELIANYLENQFYAQNKLINSFIELGTGSKHKTELILNKIIDVKAKNKQYIWVDASVPMLDHNTQQFINEEKYSNLKLKAISTDFEDPEKLLSLMNESGLKIIPEGHKMFFMLGYTLFNLNRDLKFLEKYYNIMSENDVLLITANFIPDEYRLNSSDVLMDSIYVSEILKSYESEQAKTMLLNGLSELKNFKSAQIDVTYKPVPSGNKASIIQNYCEFICKAQITLINNKKIEDVEILKIKRYYYSEYKKFIEKIGFKELSKENDNIIDHPADENTKLLILTK